VSLVFRYNDRTRSRKLRPVFLRAMCSLKYEDCVPDEELKKRIDAWIAEGSVRPSNLDEPVSMDVDEVANRPE
jgi:hypothetical protein